MRILVATLGSYGDIYPVIVASDVAECCGRIASRLEQAQPLVDASELIEAMLER